jgi:hypothetical protein
MSSTLTVTNLTATNLTDGSGTTSTFANIATGTAKVLLYYGSQAIISSTNISSVTDSATGQLAISFSNNFANDDWVGHHTTEDEQPYINTDRTVSGVTLINKDRTDGTTDASDGNATIYGDLA